MIAPERAAGRAALSATEPREVVPERIGAMSPWPEDKLVAYPSQTLARWHPEAAARAAQIKATKPAPAPSLP
jgi:hypothetical protein